MAAQWYVWVNGQEYGPISSGELQQCAAQGRIRPDTPVRQATDANWTPSGQVRGLYPAAQGPQPPPVAGGVPPVRPAPSSPFPAAPAYPQQTVHGQRPGYTQPVAPVANDPFDFLTSPGGGSSAPPAAPYGASGYGGGAASPAARPRSAPKQSQKTTIGIAAGVFVVLAIFGGYGAMRGFFKNPQQEFETAIREVNKRLPIQVDEVTRLDRYEAGPNLTGTAVYTVSVEVTAEQRQALQKMVTETMRNDPNVIKYKKLGAKLRVRYLNSAGAKIMEFGV